MKQSLECTSQHSVSWPPLPPPPSQPAAASGVQDPQEPQAKAQASISLCATQGLKAPVPPPPQGMKTFQLFILLLHNFPPPILESADAKL